MSVTSFLLLLLVAAVCGTLAQALVGYSVGGCLISALVGFLGAWLGGWIAGQFGLPEPLPVHIGGETFPVLWSIVGSAVLVGLLALLRRGRMAAL